MKYHLKTGLIYSISSVPTWFNRGQRVHLLRCLCVRETSSKQPQSPTENYRDIATAGIKDDNSPFLHLINGADLCRQPLTEWLKPSLNTDCWGSRKIKASRWGGRSDDLPPFGFRRHFHPSLFQHATNTTYRPHKWPSLIPNSEQRPLKLCWCWLQYLFWQHNQW